MPHLLDHLMPALAGADAYGGALDALPIGVWLRSPLIPWSMDRSSILSNVPTLTRVSQFLDKGSWRRSTPDDFRYRVVLRDGARRIERADVRDGRLDVSHVFLSSENARLLPRIRGADFAASATVDPKQNWKVKVNTFHGMLDGPILFVSVATVSLLGGGYLLYNHSKKMR